MGRIRIGWAGWAGGVPFRSRLASAGVAEPGLILARGPGRTMLSRTKTDSPRSGPPGLVRGAWTEPRVGQIIRLQGRRHDGRPIPRFAKRRQNRLSPRMTDNRLPSFVEMCVVFLSVSRRDQHIRVGSGKRQRVPLNRQGLPLQHAVDLRRRIVDRCRMSNKPPRRGIAGAPERSHRPNDRRQLVAVIISRGVVVAVRLTLVPEDRPESTPWPEGLHLLTDPIEQRLREARQERLRARKPVANLRAPHSNADQSNRQGALIGASQLHRQLVPHHSPRRAAIAVGDRLRIVGDHPSRPGPGRDGVHRGEVKRPAIGRVRLSRSQEDFADPYAIHRDDFHHVTANGPHLNGVPASLRERLDRLELIGSERDRLPGQDNGTRSNDLDIHAIARRGPSPGSRSNRNLPSAGTPDAPAEPRAGSPDHPQSQLPMPPFPARPGWKKPEPLPEADPRPSRAPHEFQAEPSRCLLRIADSELRRPDRFPRRKRSQYRTSSCAGFGSVRWPAGMSPDGPKPPRSTRPARLPKPPRLNKRVFDPPGAFDASEEIIVFPNPQFRIRNPTTSPPDHRVRDRREDRAGSSSPTAAATRSTSSWVGCPRRQSGPNDAPVPAVALERDRAELVGAEQGDPAAPQKAEGLGMRVAEFVVPAHAGHGQLGPDRRQPAGIGPVAAAVVGQLEDRAVPHEVRAVLEPPMPLGAFAVPRQEDRERSILQPDADRVIILLLAGPRGPGERSSAPRSPVRSFAVATTAGSP